MRNEGLWNESTDEPYLPEDALLHVSLSNGDGITGVTLMERPQIGAVIKDGFKVQEKLDEIDEPTTSFCWFYNKPC